MSQYGPMRSVLPPIHREGWPFIAIFFAVAVILGFLWVPLFWVGLLATAWCVFFFRDPPRVTPDDPSLVVSPADGVVVATSPRVPPPELEMGARPLPCVAVFMNVFDVHVNRTPVAGTITGHAYHHGKFLNASFDKASDENERRSWRIRASGGREIGLVQIAGLVARRIVPFEESGRRGPGGRAGRADPFRQPLRRLPARGHRPARHRGPKDCCGRDRPGRSWGPAGGAPRTRGLMVLGQRRRRVRLSAQPLRNLIPNMITILALCAGMTGVRYGLDGRFELAVSLIVSGGRAGRPGRPLGPDARTARARSGPSSTAWPTS